MAKRKYPEQRSTTASAQPGATPAHPTGEEVYRSPESPGATGEEGLTEEELEELRDLRQAAAEAYADLMHATGKIADRAAVGLEEGRRWIRNYPAAGMLGAFALGAVLGFLSRRM